MRYVHQLSPYRSLSAMTSEHGQLLQESGYGKPVLPRSSSGSLELITTRPVTESSSLFGTVLVRLSSGKHVMPSTPRTGDPSTLAALLQGIECMSATRQADLRVDLSCSARIYSQLLRSESAELRLGTQSWAQSLASIPSRYSPDYLLPSTLGWTQTRLDARRGMISANVVHSLDAQLFNSLPYEIRSHCL